MSADLDAALEQFKATFFEESAEQLAEVEERLGAIRGNLDNVESEDLHATFRAVHSIKGGAGAFEFTDVVEFAHKMETLLDLMRNNAVRLDAELVDLLTAANDCLIELVEVARDGGGVDDARVTDLARRLEAAQKGGVDPGNAAPSADPRNAAPAPDPNANPDSDATAESGDLRRFHIDFQPNEQLFKFGNDPLLLLRELRDMGIATFTPRTGALPRLDSLDPETCYLAWHIEIETAQSREDIEEVFEFVADDCHLVITEHARTTQDTPAPKAETATTAGEGKDGGERSGEGKGGGTSLAPSSPPSSAPPSPSGSDKTAAPNGTGAKGESETVNARQESTVRGGGRNDGAPSSIRVELDRVDRLVNMVSELVITQSMLRQQLSELPPEHAGSMSQGFEDLDMHLRDLQESVMAVRMQPVRSVFARIPRLVRDIAGKLGKRVELAMRGENTEVDKTVIEQLSDPLTHMIRNALDHGIETADERAATNKPAQATIWLKAEHKSGRIVITVADDGRGINRGKVLAKARERGIVAPDAQLSDDEIDELIYAPGFSTSEGVSDLSGRGVGMDVVRQNIVSLGGRLSVVSAPGEGTRFIMSLPLTLAVLDGMIVSVGSEYYILPLTSIVETIRPQHGQIHHLANGAEVLAARGDYIRLVRLNETFGIQDAVESPEHALVVIAESEGVGQIGILIDEMLGQQQVVIKSLEENYGQVPGIAAATILGSGRVALILDVNALGDLARLRGRRRGPGQKPRANMSLEYG